MKSYLVDTNFLLRFLLNDIPSQFKRATKYIVQAKDKKIKIIIPQFILFELHYVLSKYYKFPKTKVIEIIQGILNSTYLNIEDRNLFFTSLSLWKKNNIELVDNFLLSLSKEKQASILTFDQKLKNQTS